MLGEVSLIFIGFPVGGPPSCSRLSTLIPLIVFVLFKISLSITLDFLLLSQSLYSKLIEPIKSSDASDWSDIFPLKAYIFLNSLFLDCIFKIIFSTLET